MDKVERLSAELKQLTQEIEDQRAVLSQDASHGRTWEGWSGTRPCHWWWCKDGTCFHGWSGWLHKFAEIGVVSGGTPQNAAVSD